MYNILCAGCSFTAGWNHTSNLAIIDRPVEDQSKVSTDISSDIGTSLIPADYINGHPRDKYEVPIEVKDFVQNPYVSYTNYLPEDTYNIGNPGGGIQSQYISTFITQNKDIQLTHFIYQVPSPSRQPFDVNCSKDDDDEFWGVSSPPVKLGIWRLLKRGRPVDEFNHIIDVFKNRDLFLNRALRKVNNNVKTVRRQYPNVKIIFLRYEDIQKPFINEFDDGFYKLMLTDYCKRKNIPYIYEENFNTKWFLLNKLTTDTVHPNKDGAKVIADKIKEYL